MMSSLYYTALRLAGLPQGIRRIRNAGVILCYHNVVADDSSPELGDPSLHMPQAQFRKQLGWLATNYTVVPLREMVDRMTHGKTLRRLAALTFDDAYSGVFRYARPLLEEYNCPATVFVVTSAPDGGGGGFWWDHPATRTAAAAERLQWLTELRGDRTAILAQLRAPTPPAAPPALQPADWTTLARARDSLIELGVHSATHRTLPRLDDAELADEVIASRDTLREKTGAHGTLFSYPYGLWDARVREVVKDAGYAAAVSLDVGLASRRSDSWSLPRINIPRTIGTPAFEAWTAGLAR